MGFTWSRRSTPVLRYLQCEIRLPRVQKNCEKVRIASFAAQLVMEPGPSIGPEILRRPTRDTHDLRNLLHREPSEEAQLDQLRRLLVGGGEPGQGIIKV